MPTATPADQLGTITDSTRNGVNDWLLGLNLSRPETIEDQARRCALEWLRAKPYAPEPHADFAIKPEPVYPYVAADLQPGNGTAYRIFLTRLEASDASSAGGELLVSLPDFHKSMVIGLPAFVMPYYVDEKLNLAGGSNAIVAAFLTLFGALIARD